MNEAGDRNMSAGNQPQDAALQTAGRQGPLAGIRVLEMGTLIAGPFGARLLAEFIRAWRQRVWASALAIRWRRCIP
jgi:hypothetical protein